MKKIKVTITKIECLRCGHTWIARKEEKDIKICPKCKSPYFNIPRREK